MWYNNTGGYTTSDRRYDCETWGITVARGDLLEEHDAVHANMRGFHY